MDDGTYMKILKHWGVESGALDKAEINRPISTDFIPTIYINNEGTEASWRRNKSTATASIFRIASRRCRLSVRARLWAAVIVALLAAMLLQGLITNPRFEWNVVWKYLFNENVLEGIKYTLLLTVISMVIAIILAVILAVMRKSINPVLRGVSWFYIWFFRGTPVYTQLVFWGLFAVLVPRIGVGIPFTSIEFWSIDSQSVITAFNAAWLGLALNEAAYLAEIVRAGLEAVDPGQTEAAKHWA